MHYKAHIFVETYRLTKHLRTSSCLQTNSIKRGDVILFKNRKMFLVSAIETNLNYITGWVVWGFFK